MIPQLRTEYRIRGKQGRWMAIRHILDDEGERKGTMFIQEHMGSAYVGAAHYFRDDRVKPIRRRRR